MIVYRPINFQAGTLLLAMTDSLYHFFLLITFHSLFFLFLSFRLFHPFSFLSLLLNISVSLFILRQVNDLFRKVSTFSLSITLSFFLSFCLFFFFSNQFFLFFYKIIHLFIHFFFYIFINLFVFSFIHLFNHSFIRFFIYSFTHLSLIRLFIYAFN